MHRKSAGSIAPMLGRILVILGCVALNGCRTTASGPELDAADPAPPRRMVTQGLATTIIENLYRCPQKVKDHRISAVGQITATDGTVLTVPAETVFQKKLGPMGADLYNECNQVPMLFT